AFRQPQTVLRRRGRECHGALREWGLAERRRLGGTGGDGLLLLGRFTAADPDRRRNGEHRAARQYDRRAVAFRILPQCVPVLVRERTAQDQRRLPAAVVGIAVQRGLPEPARAYGRR